QSLDTFMCPSDSPDAMPSGAMSYPGNLGYGFRPDLTQHANNGIFALSRRVGEGDITDGMSRTVAVSEWVIGDGPVDPLGAVFAIPNVIGDLDRFRIECTNIDVQNSEIVLRFK